MATTEKQWTNIVGWPRDNGVGVFRYSNDDETDLASSGDDLKFTLPHGLPAKCEVAWVSLVMDQFDSDGTPTGVFDVVLTDGSTEFELISAAPVGRAPTVGDSATSPGSSRAADEALGFRQEVDDDWYILLRLGAALATATSSGRAVKLLVAIRAIG